MVADDGAWRAHASGESSRETGLGRRWRAAGGVLQRLQEEPKKHGKGGGLGLELLSRGAERSTGRERGRGTREKQRKLEREGEERLAAEGIRVCRLGLQVVLWRCPSDRVLPPWCDGQWCAGSYESDASGKKTSRRLVGCWAATRERLNAAMASKIQKKNIFLN
jgi:hypothetical protein